MDPINVVFLSMVTFHDDVMAAFPELADSGGYELMRTKQNNRELCVIPGGYTAEYLKSIMGQAKVYICPIQRDLSITPVNDESVFSVSADCYTV